MNINELEIILENNSVKDINDKREIVKFKNNIEDGNEIGVVLSFVEKNKYEVFIHITIDNKVYSKLLYSTFDDIEKASNKYEQLEKLIIEYDVKTLIKMIKIEGKIE